MLAHQAMMLSVTGVLCAAYLLMELKLLLTRGRCRIPVAWLSRTFRLIFSQRQLQGGEKTTLRIMRQRHHSFLAAGMPYFARCGAFLCIVSMLSLPRLRADDLLASNLVPGWILGGAGVVLTLQPRFLTPCVLRCAYASLVAQLISEVAISPGLCSTPYYVSSLMFYRSLYAIGFADAPVSLFLNAAYTGAFGLIVVLRGQAEYVVPALVFELVAFLTVACLTVVLHSWNFAMAQAIVEAARSATSKVTIDRILTSMCDAVIHVDSDYRLQQPSPRLEALLLSRMTGVTSAGKSFIDYIDEQSKAQFRETFASEELDLAALHTTQETACTCHVKLRTAYGTLVSVQTFAASYVDISGALHRIIGIREESWESQARLAGPADGQLQPWPEDAHPGGRGEAPPAAPPTGAIPTEQIALGEGAGIPRGDSDPDRASRGSGPDTSAELGAAMQGVGGVAAPDSDSDRTSQCSGPDAGAELWMLVIASSPTFRICSFSEGLRAVIGEVPEQHRHLTKWIRRRDWQPFATWFHCACNAELNSTRPDPFCGRLNLRPPHLARCRMVIAASEAHVEECRLEWADGDSGDIIVAKLRLLGVDVSAGWQQPRPRGTPSTPPCVPPTAVGDSLHRTPASCPRRPDKRQCLVITL